MTSNDPAVRNSSRDTSSQTYDRSRRMSVAHASRAIRAHDLPRRGLGGIPLPTRSTTLSIVTSSTMATATIDRGIS